MSLSRPLPLLAVVGVLLSGILVVLGRPAPAAAPGHVAGSLGAVVVDGPGGAFSVGPRWTRTSADALLFYAEPRGGPSGGPPVGLTGAVVADAGYCGGLPTSLRGFAGLTAVSPSGTPPQVARREAARWAGAVSGRAPPSTTRVPITRVRLAEGTPAARATLRLRVRGADDPCLARRVVVDVVGFATTGGVATFVLVRDVDPAGVGEAEADDVVSSLRAVPTR